MPIGDNVVDEVEKIQGDGTAPTTDALASSS